MTNIQQRNNDSIDKDDATSFNSKSRPFGNRNTLAEAVNKVVRIKTKVQNNNNNNNNNNDMFYQGQVGGND